MYFFISLFPSFDFSTPQETDAGLWTNVPSHVSNLRSQSQLNNWRICLQRKAQECLVWRRFRGILKGIITWQGAENWKDGDRLLVLLSERTRGNGHNMQKTCKKVLLRKSFFSVRMIKHWNRLLNLSAFLKVPKTKLDTLLRNLL